MTEDKDKTKASKAKASRAKVKAKASKVQERTKGHSDGFLNFVREQGVVGLAVGLAIGTAAGSTVKVIVQEFIDPIIALITQGVNLSALRWVIISADKSANQEEVSIGYGAILTSVIVLMATALVIYLIVHLAKLDRLDRKK